MFENTHSCSIHPDSFAFPEEPLRFIPYEASFLLPHPPDIIWRVDPQFDTASPSFPTISTFAIDGFELDRETKHDIIMYPQESIINSQPWPPIDQTIDLTATELERSLVELERDTHEAVGIIRTHVQGAKGTGVTYARHVQHYQDFWEVEENLRLDTDPQHALIPVYPITAAKVAKFVMSEMKREKVSIHSPVLFTIELALSSASGAVMTMFRVPLSADHISNS